MPPLSKSQLSEVLRKYLGNSAQFRADQFEAIDEFTSRSRILVVQRTGWGKSVVYFMATKLLRDKGSGPTIAISPLISLMRNQVEYGDRFGIKVNAIHSGNQDGHENIFESITANSLDLLLISSERLKV